MFALQGNDDADQEDTTMIGGIIILHNSWIMALFDTEASHSFISTSCALALGLEL